MTAHQDKHAPLIWRRVLHEIIFEADTPAGKAFDILLIISILLSVLIVMLDSVSQISLTYGRYLHLGEWFFTLLFTLEYALRIICVTTPFRYMTSFFGLVDLLSVLPTYIGLLLPGSHYMMVIRILRVIRIFRVLKFAQYLGESAMLLTALKASRRKITIFLFTVMLIVIIVGALMYMVEGHENGFTSIPRSIYWAIVTLTTVGYGDISPKTNAGQALAALVMILGYGIIAVPTGIVTVEMTKTGHDAVSTQACPNCAAEGHDHDARHCKYCGEKL